MIGTIRTILFLLGLCCLFNLRVMAQDTLTLAAGWKIQPAQGPGIAPDPGAWGSLALPLREFDWRSEQGAGKGTSWENADHGSIHDLWFEHSFRMPAGWAKRRIALDLRRLEGDAILFVNGRRIAEILRPGGEVDITS